MLKPMRVQLVNYNVSHTITPQLLHNLYLNNFVHAQPLLRLMDEVDTPD